MTCILLLTDGFYCSMLQKWRMRLREGYQTKRLPWDWMHPAWFYLHSYSTLSGELSSPVRWVMMDLFISPL